MFGQKFETSIKDGEHTFDFLTEVVQIDILNSCLE